MRIEVALPCASFALASPAGAQADFDQSGVVVGGDLLRLGAAFGSRVGEPRYDARLDMDSDGAIGVFEYLALARSFGAAPGWLRP